MNARLSWHSSPDAATEAMMPDSLRAPDSRGVASESPDEFTLQERSFHAMDVAIGVVVKSGVLGHVTTMASGVA